MPIEDYFTDMEIIEKEETSDDLGGFTTKYVSKGKVKGLLQRASSTERTIAAQLGIKNVYTFMTLKTSISDYTIDSNTLIRDVKSGNVGIIDSSPLEGQKGLENIIQWGAESYAIPEGTVI